MAEELRLHRWDAIAVKEALGVAIEQAARADVKSFYGDVLKRVEAFLAGSKAWKQVDEKRYDEMLNALPPYCFTHQGFLVGEPMRDKKCGVTGKLIAAYTAFCYHNMRFYEADDPMTPPEFRAFIASGVDPSLVKP